MKKKLMLLLAVATASRCLAQELGKATLANHAIREFRTTPPYGLEKVRQLIKTRTVRREDEDDETGTDSLPEKLYRALSLREKFTYNMIYGESYSQNCDAGWIYPDEEKKIFGQLPDLFGEQNWSDRQLAFFSVNKDTVIALMLLGRINEYPVFKASISYQKLYAGKEKYYNGSLVFNSANEALIIQRATDFYNGRPK